MDKILFYIIFFYFISIFLRFLKEKDPKKRRQRPHLPPQPSHYPVPTRPSPRPLPRKEAGKPSTVITPQEREALQILDEWEKRAGRLKRKQIEPQISAKERKIFRQKTEKKPLEKREKPAAEKKEPVSPYPESFFSRPSEVRQGIIISEILRPPLARRNPFLPPYLRG